MLQNIRKSSQGTAAKIVVGIIVVSFALFGIESILLSGGNAGIAEVNGEQITPLEVQQAVNTQKRRLMAMLGDNIDPAMLDDQRLSAQVLDGIIGRRLLTQSARDMNMLVSERQVGSLIGSMEQFQVDGKFSPEAYRNVLASAGFSPASFKQSLEQDMLVTQVQSGLAGSEFVTPAELELTTRITAEQRDVRYLTIPLQQFEDQTEVSDTQIQAYFEQHKDQYRTPESVELDYISLAREDFRKPVSEAEIRERYELEKDNYSYGTENRVSHVLFERGSDETADQLASRIAKAQAQLAEGEAFAEVATRFSDDVGSAASGGDLGFSSGDAFPPEMEEVISGLALHTVSAPVETDAGTHLLVVTERREASAPTLAELRPELELRLQDEVASRELISQVEALRDLVFNAEALAAPAKELDLTVLRSGPITRDQKTGVFANPSLLAAAFSEDVLEAGHNSEVIETGDNTFTVLRVRKHNPPAIRPLEQVRADIIAAIKEQAAREAATQQAVSIAAEVNGGESLETIAIREGYEWQVELGADRRNTVLPAEVLQRVFEFPIDDEGVATVDYVASPEGDLRLVQLVRVTPGDVAKLAEPEQAELRRQLRSEFGSLVQLEYQQGLRENADINILQ